MHLAKWFSGSPRIRSLKPKRYNHSLHNIIVKVRREAGPTDSKWKSSCVHQKCKWITRIIVFLLFCLVGEKVEVHKCVKMNDHAVCTKKNKTTLVYSPRVILWQIQADTDTLAFMLGSFPVDRWHCRWMISKMPGDMEQWITEACFLPTHHQQLWLMELKMTASIRLSIWLSISKYLYCTLTNTAFIQLSGNMAGSTGGWPSWL